MNLSKHIPAFLEACSFAAAVFVIHCVLALGFQAYDRFSWMDVIMHLLGGIAIAHFIATMTAYGGSLSVLVISKGLAFSLFVFGLVATATVLWEFAEFLADTFFDAGSQRSIANIMKDQFFGLVGGASYLAVLHRTTSGQKAN